MFNKKYLLILYFIFVDDSISKVICVAVASRFLINSNNYKLLIEQKIKKEIKKEKYYDFIF